MKIVIDKNIPFIRGVFDDMFSVVYMSGNDMNRESVKDADCLIIRTRTKCNEKLLQDTSVRLVATATAGYEHIDIDFCKANNIDVFISKGCNASSVAQYIGSVIAYWIAKKDIGYNDISIGIVGYGSVGKQVKILAEKLGFRTFLNDPPLELNKQQNIDFVSLEEIADQCDIITFHTPLERGGGFPTYHLADEYFFSNCKKSPLIINAARGGVVDERAMLKAFSKGLIDSFAIDCWEGEPNISKEVLEKSIISTPHIAGYSADGKLNATSMCIDSVCRFFDISCKNNFSLSNKKQVNLKGILLGEALLENYDVIKDSLALRENPKNFEMLRNNYPIRRELDI